MEKNWRPETLCVQAGWEPTNGEPRVLPIYQSTTFKYDTSEQMARLFDLKDSGYFYTRLQNPTNDAVAAKIAALEGGVAAMLTSSGQAANFFTAFNICEAGDHIVSATSIYGGTFNLFAVTMKKMGVECTFIDQDASEEEIDKAFRPNTKMMFGELLSNPGVMVLDVEKFARIAHRHGVPLVVDNTFATPINCRPIEWGADIVTHSTTKYMDGHACCVGGCIVDSGNFDWDAHAEKFPGLCQPDESYHGLTYTKAFGKLAFITKATSQLMRDLGSIQAPMNAFLLNLGLESLHLRVPRHCQNAQRVAEWLEANDKVAWVNYPGLKSNKYYDLAQKYAQRLLRRAFLRAEGRTRRRHPLHGQPEARRHRYPCCRRAHLHLAPGEPYAPAADRRTAPRGGHRSGFDAPLGGYRKCGRYYRGYRPSVK